MTAPPFRLDGKVAVVTGGGSGIGQAIAACFAHAGATVVVAGRSRGPLDAVAAAIGGVALPCDTTDPAAVDALFAAAAGLTGRIDVLVNNAGQGGPIGEVGTVDLAAWRDCLEVNLFGALHCLRAAAPRMAAQRGGSIINMSSMLGLRGYPMRTAYVASKFALIGITESVARELGPHGVRVNAICPGAVRGELMDAVVARRAATEGRPDAEIVQASYFDQTALGRWVEADEVAAAALFLASDASASITGDRIRVDAGRF